MGTVLDFRPRPAASPDASNEMAELQTLRHVGGIGVTVCARPAETETGPYFLVLRAPGFEDFTLVEVGWHENATAATVERDVGIYATVALTTLHAADTLKHLLPSNLPSPAEPA